MLSIRKINCLILALGLLLWAAPATYAQKTRQVRFQRGQNSATFAGKLPRQYADYDAYVIRARKGQTLTVRLVSDDEQASITVYETKEFGPDQDRITPEETTLKEWSGKLPITSEYSVQVYGATSFDQKGSGKPYTIEISVK
jgi:hypothetical protein